MVKLADIADAGVIAGLFLIAVLAYRICSDKLKYAVLGGSVLFIGFYRARMISIVDVSQIVTLAFPPIFTNLYWYLLFGLGLATSLVWGRMYCGYLCPFGAFTQILHRLSPIDARIPLWIHTKASYLKYAFLIFVVAGILLGGLWVVGFEPFQTFFSSQGALWMWIVMGLAVVLSIPFERFYCSYVCPAGAALSLVGSLRVKEINRWPECARCKICQNACPEGAITGAKISTLSCMNCRVCENNYLDDRLCPHYAILRAASRAGPRETAGTT
jgi:polyferredoxin